MFHLKWYLSGESLGQLSPGLAFLSRSTRHFCVMQNKHFRLSLTFTLYHRCLLSCYKHHAVFHQIETFALNSRVSGPFYLHVKCMIVNNHTSKPPCVIPWMVFYLRHAGHRISAQSPRESFRPENYGW